MNSPKSYNSGSEAAEVDRTLRLLATLPAPEGLEDRIHAKLRNSPRSSHILEWPAGLRSTGSWMRSTAMRSAAAAAIVFVVAGGGWGIYMRVQPSKVIVMPARVASPGFSGAKAMRTPDPFTPPKAIAPAAVVAPGKAPSKIVPMPLHHVQAAGPAKANPVAKGTAQPAGTPVK